jgi:hypothetical protein
MKLADRTVEVHSAGINSTNQFTIAQTSKMFKILSDSLYSDKTMAVIRELATNAYDSHISAGNKNPFKVTLPTAANPNFAVRDYGTGLNQKDMEHLYTTYGASNKNDSNDFVGCLGLGSKSPFAYTKSFTTTSYFNGTQYTYIAAIDDTGVPTLNLIHSTDTNEPNGLEISFAVKQYDFQEFSQKAVRVFHYFKNKPIIEGGVHWDFTKEYSQRNVVIDGDGWRVCRLNNDNMKFPNNYHRIQSGVIALMGNIAYPVEVSHLIGEEKAETPDHIAKWNRAFNKADIASWKSFVGEIINQGLYLELDFGIGELEMDVSREGLQYTKSVVKTLREKTQDIFVELKKNFSDKIATAKTKVEAIQTYYQMNDLAGGWGVGASWTDASGKDHSISSGQDIEYKLDKEENLYVFNYRTAGYRSRRMIYLTNQIHHDTLTGKGYNYWNTSGKKNGGMKFFWCDISATETAKKIVTKYCNTNDCFAYLLVHTKDHTNVSNGFKSLVKDVGEHNILNVSDYRDLIKSTPKARGSKGSKGSVSDQDIFLIFGDQKNTSPLNYDYNDATLMRSLSIDSLNDLEDADEIVYIPILRYATATTDYPTINGLYSHKDFFEKYKVFDNTNIYAIKHSVVDRLIKEGYNLVDFNTWFKTRLKKLNDNKFKDIYQFNSLVEQCRNEYNSDDKMNRGYGQGYIDRQFLFHMLNMFGLEYDQFINNKKIVSTLDSLMILEFFTDTIHREEFDIAKFKKDDYYGHMTKLLNDFGINDLDSAKIKDSNVVYNQINRIIDSMYDSDKVSQYKSIFKKTESDNEYVAPKIADLRKTIKAELDNNPILKYTMCVTPVSGNLRELRNVNPLKQNDGSRGYYHRDNNGWFSTINDLDKLKVQFGQIIG